jgi:hypothetical protein
MRLDRFGRSKFSAGLALLRGWPQLLGAAGSWGFRYFRATSAMTEQIEHRGYRLSVQPHGSGYKILIYPPGSTIALPTIPFDRNKSKREDLIEEAKCMADDHNSWPKQGFERSR